MRFLLSSRFFAVQKIQTSIRVHDHLIDFLDLGKISWFSVVLSDWCNVSPVTV